jgi:hypothetical protein
MGRRKDSTVTDVDVDVAPVDDELEDTAAPGTEVAAAEKPAKAKKEPARGDLPEGYVTPVGLAKHITEKGLHKNRDGEVAELKPQMVYSYVKNAPKEFPHPFVDVTDSLGKTRQAAKLEDAVNWWTARAERAAARKANAAEKAAKKTSKTEKSEAVETEDVSEAVEAE